MSDARYSNGSGDGIAHMSPKSNSCDMHLVPHDKFGSAPDDYNAIVQIIAGVTLGINDIIQQCAQSNSDIIGNVLCERAKVSCASGSSCDCTLKCVKWTIHQIQWVL